MKFNSSPFQKTQEEMKTLGILEGKSIFTIHPSIHPSYKNAPVFPPIFAITMASKRREGFPLPRNFLARYLPSHRRDGPRETSRIPTSGSIFHSVTRASTMIEKRNINERKRFFERRNYLTTLCVCARGPSSRRIP